MRLRIWFRGGACGGMGDPFDEGPVRHRKERKVKNGRRPKSWPSHLNWHSDDERSSGIDDDAPMVAPKAAKKADPKVAPKRAPKAAPKAAPKVARKAAPKVAQKRAVKDDNNARKKIKATTVVPKPHEVRPPGSTAFARRARSEERTIFSQQQEVSEGVASNAVQQVKREGEEVRRRRRMWHPGEDDENKFVTYEQKHRAQRKHVLERIQGAINSKNAFEKSLVGTFEESDETSLVPQKETIEIEERLFDHSHLPFFLHELKKIVRSLKKGFSIEEQIDACGAREEVDELRANLTIEYHEFLGMPEENFLGYKRNTDRVVKSLNLIVKRLKTLYETVTDYSKKFGKMLLVEKMVYLWNVFESRLEVRRETCVKNAEFWDLRWELRQDGSEGKEYYVISPHALFSVPNFDPFKSEDDLDELRKLYFNTDFCEDLVCARDIISLFTLCIRHYSKEAFWVDQLVHSILKKEMPILYYYWSTDKDGPWCDVDITTLAYSLNVQMTTIISTKPEKCSIPEEHFPQAPPDEGLTPKEKRELSLKRASKSLLPGDQVPRNKYKLKPKLFAKESSSPPYSTADWTKNKDTYRHCPGWEIRIRPKKSQHQKTDAPRVCDPPLNDPDPFAHKLLSIANEFSSAEAKALRDLFDEIVGDDSVGERSEEFGALQLAEISEPPGSLSYRSSSGFPCKFCKEGETTTVREFQKRSGDEAMDVELICKTCRRRQWAPIH